VCESIRWKISSSLDHRMGYDIRALVGGGERICKGEKFSKKGGRAREEIEEITQLLGIDVVAADPKKHQKRDGRKCRKGISAHGKARGPDGVGLQDGMSWERLILANVHQVERELHSPVTGEEHKGTIWPLSRLRKFGERGY